MQAAHQALGDGVLLGAMLSNSITDKPKIFKDLTDKPDEHFQKLFGAPGLSMANYEAVFDRLFIADKNTGENYKKRVIGLGNMANTWFDTFNKSLQSMPVQNLYLLQQTLITTSAIYVYNNPAIQITNSPSTTIDQVHRLMLIISDKDFTVARFVYGNTLDKSTSRRLPTTELIQQILG